MGFEVYQGDHKDANGLYEINFGWTNALFAVDRLTPLLKWLLCAMGIGREAPGAPAARHRSPCFAAIQRSADFPFPLCE